ncbi:MAG: hypothetical protein ACE5DM_03125 [Candidatus Nanoarchaeia archaeon]
MNKLIPILFVLLLQSSFVIASFNVGDPPEKPAQPATSELTGHTVVEPDKSDLGYWSFVIALFFVLLGGILYLFQRVKPR